MDIKQVNSAIMFGEFTDTELTSIIDAVRFARASLVKSNKRQLTIGAKVKFTSHRNGMTYQGTVDKIKVKFVLVNTPQGRYNVPANMLEVA
jgi:hypothetical protein